MGHSSGPPDDGHSPEPPGPLITPDQVVHATLCQKFNCMNSWPHVL